jgi:hypothetical protein
VYKYADKSGNYYFSKVNGEFVSINNEELQRIIELSKEKNRSKFKSDLTVDIYSGINMGDLDYNTAIVKRSKTASSDGFTIGFNINKPFKNNWHIMSGLNFTKHNYSVIDPYKLSCNFWSLNLPLLINYSINFNGLNISPMAGTLFIYRNLKENELSAEITLYEEYNSSFHTLNYSYSNELLKTYNVGMNYGIVVLYKAFSIAYSQNRYFEHNLDYVENQIVLSFRLKQAK